MDQAVSSKRPWQPHSRLCGFPRTADDDMTLAFAAAPITVTQPVTFLQLVWSVLIGAVFFGEPADPWVILGGGVIMASVIFITLREARLRKVHRTPTVNETKG